MHFIAIITGFLVFRFIWARVSIPMFKYYWNWQNGRATGQITYLALGDSAAQGIGAWLPHTAYVWRVARFLRKHSGTSVRIVNLSVTGAKVEDCLGEQIPQLNNYKPDIITVGIGSNNFRNLDKRQFRSDFKKLLAQLPPDKTVVANTPAFYGGGPRDNSIEMSRIVDELVAQTGHHKADLFNASLHINPVLGYGGDFFHPSEFGYTWWAKAFTDKIKDIQL